MMAIEAVNKIKYAEETAAAAIKEATLSAKDILKEASIKADAVYSDIIKDARAKNRDIIAEAKKQAHAESEEYVLSGGKDIENLKNPSGDKVNKAVGLIVAEILKV